MYGTRRLSKPIAELYGDPATGASLSAKQNLRTLRCAPTGGRSWRGGGVVYCREWSTLSTWTCCLPPPASLVADVIPLNSMSHLDWNAKGFD